MDWTRIRANWGTFKGRLRSKWGKLTDDDGHRAEPQLLAADEALVLEAPDGGGAGAEGRCGRLAHWPPSCPGACACWPGASWLWYCTGTAEPTAASAPVPAMRELRSTR